MQVCTLAGNGQCVQRSRLQSLPGFTAHINELIYNGQSLSIHVHNDCDMVDSGVAWSLVLFVLVLASAVCVCELVRLSPLCDT